MVLKKGALLHPFLINKKPRQWRGNLLLAAQTN